MLAYHEKKNADRSADEERPLAVQYAFISSCYSAHSLCFRFGLLLKRSLWKRLFPLSTQVFQ